MSGDAYTGSILPMQIIMPTLFLIGISNLLGIQILVPMDRENDVLKSVSLGAIVNLLINAIFISRFGASGAAFGTLVAEFFVTSYQIYVLRDFLKEIVANVKLYKNIISTLLATILVLIANTLFISNISSLFMVLVISAIIFGLIYGLVGLLLKEEFTMYLLRYMKK